MLTMSSSYPSTERRAMCHHDPHCPPAEAVDREAAHVVAGHPEQGWSLLCNGVVLFEDTGELLPDGDRKSTRLNSSHVAISYAVFCLKKKRKQPNCQAFQRCVRDAGRAVG